MSRRQTAAATRSPRRQTTKDFSTAFLLPGLHPWLKEFFAERNLVAVSDEALGVLPDWEPIPIYGAQNTEYAATENGATMAEPAVEPIAQQPKPVKVNLATEMPTVGLAECGCVPAPTITMTLPPQDAALFHTGQARRSMAPVPFAVPVYVATAVPSRHFLRLTRCLIRLHQYNRRTTSPNFITPFVSDVADNVAARKPGRVQFWMRPRSRTPAPTFPVLPPYNELLIVNVLLGPLNVLWRTVGWPLVEFTGISNLWTRTKNNWSVRFGAASRQALAFAVAILVILLPVKLIELRGGLPRIGGRVLSATAEALTAFQSGGAAIRRSSFYEAITAFDRMRTALEEIPNKTGALPKVALVVGRYVPGLRSTVNRAEDARRAGIGLAAASSSMARGLATLERINLGETDAAPLLDAAAASFSNALTFAERARAGLSNAAPQFVPPLERAIGELRRAEYLLPIIKALGGMDRPRRILFIFQNPAELRPTGGFIGSVALVDVANGRVQSVELPAGGSYDVSGVTRLRVIPPEPLRLVADTWQFHDANWFPDFPTTARKLRWFFEASGGPSVDAVVAVNAPVLERIIELTGPIAAGGRIFTSTAAVAALTDAVEGTNARATNRPKAIIGELAPEIIRRLLAITDRGMPEQRLQLIDRIIQALEERDILLSFADDGVQRVVVAARWAGAVRAVDGDALLVVHTNIGGGKSDAAIRDDVAHTATILDDGSVVDVVTVTRTHTGIPATPEAAPFERLKGSHNIDFLRLYVPRGAALLAAEGFEPPPPSAFGSIPTDAIPDRLLLATELNESIDAATGIRTTEEFGMTAFGGWLQVSPGQTRSVRIAYRLPQRYERTKTLGIGSPRLADPQSYSFTIQKQPGTRTTIRHTVEVMPSWKVMWRTDNLKPTGSRTLTLEDILTTDRFAGLMIAPAETTKD